MPTKSAFIIPYRFAPVRVGPPSPTAPKREEFPFVGCCNFQGLVIDLENLAGSYREGKGWRNFMHHHYGEFRGSLGTDGDPLDVYVGPNALSPLAVVIHQVTPETGIYDEDKVMVGFDGEEEAIQAYMRQYDKPGFYRDGWHRSMPLASLAVWMHTPSARGKVVKATKQVRSDAGEIRVSGQGRTQYIGPVWDMTKLTYAQIGIKVSSAQELLEYDIWLLNFNKEGTPIAFTLLRTTPFGLKVGLSGSNGSLEGVRKLVSSIRTRTQNSGIYAEVSHKVRSIALAADAPVVCSALVPQVLGKPVEPVTEIDYRRIISGVGNVVKTMVGRPRGIPTTSAKAPTCPTMTASRKASPTEPTDITDHHAHMSCVALDQYL